MNPEVKALGPLNRLAIRQATRRTQHVSFALALAFASRESNCRNIVGDGGHGRGIFQLDDRYQQEFLRTHRGCRSGSTMPIYKDCLAKGRVPTVYDAAVRMCQIFEENIDQAITVGIPFGGRLRVAISAYNAGFTGALAGYRVGNADLHTTNKNYSADVLRRMASL
jgi:hypothetical protein